MTLVSGLGVELAQAIARTGHESHQVLGTGRMLGHVREPAQQLVAPAGNVGLGIEADGAAVFGEFTKLGRGPEGDVVASCRDDLPPSCTESISLATMHCAEPCRIYWISP